MDKLDKYALLGKGFFPETLPPCFDGFDLRRAFRGIVPDIRERRYQKRSGILIPYNGTKHDGSRRRFSTANPVQYFHVCEFISSNWKKINKKISGSPYVVSQPRPAPEGADRPILIPSLSNLTTEASRKLKYSPIIVRTDISQFFPSIYTHSVPWVAHGKEKSKADQNSKSKEITFNSLDFYIQHCQNSETRGVAVGPDAFRIVAEFIGSEIDRMLMGKASEHIIGGARHVDDFFIGVKSEEGARIVLSALREVLAEFHLQVNDSKTKITDGLEPLNELWAQDLRTEAANLNIWSKKSDDFTRLIIRSTELSKIHSSDSPLKIAVRSLDDARAYTSDNIWSDVEPYLQRICFAHSHCIDYIFLLVVKRSSRNKKIDTEGWSSVAHSLIKRHSVFGHDHEVVWSLWFLIVSKMKIESSLIDHIVSYRNSYCDGMLSTAYVGGLLKFKPSLGYGSKISTDNVRWLDGLISRSCGYTKANLSGSFAAEFLHLADRDLKLIDWQAHVDKMSEASVKAISRTRYGYDADDDDTFHWFSYDADDGDADDDEPDF